MKPTVDAAPAWESPGVGRRTERDPADAALETCALVLGEDSPVPGSDRDVEDLVRCLRGHIMQLGIGMASEMALLQCAQELSAAELPKGYYTPSRVYLRKLAEATRDLVDVRRDLDVAWDAVPCSRRHGRLGVVGRSEPLSRNTARIVLFAIAVITVITAGFTPPG